MSPSLARRFVPVGFSLGLTGACLFGAAGRMDWANGWLLVGLNVAASVANSVVMGLHAGLMEERGKVGAGRSWDKALTAVGVLLGPVGTWVTAGLDVRFGWSGAARGGVVGAGLAAAVVGAAMVNWAMGVNRFFSSVVRIQSDRGHTVVDGGPYGLVRHPGYAGMTLVSLATPLILGSWWALAPAAATAAANVARTELEDRTLRAELEGYQGYSERVRARLIPGIW